MKNLTQLLTYFILFLGLTQLQAQDCTALHFDGNSRVEIPDLPEVLQSTSLFTFEVWFRTPSTCGQVKDNVLFSIQSEEPSNHALDHLLRVGISNEGGIYLEINYSVTKCLSDLMVS